MHGELIKIGERSGTRIVIDIVRGNGRNKLLIRCDCGREARINSAGFRSRNTCRTCYMNTKNLLRIGERSGSRVIICIIPASSSQSYRKLQVKCDCGRESTIADTSFRNSPNCRFCHSGGPSRKYGDRLIANERLYKIWTEMRRRCRSRDGWADRGIKVCAEWDGSFVVFEKWAIENGYGEKLSIDRVDPYGNYEPSNCEWVTRGENSRRSRIWNRTSRVERLPSSGLLSFGC
jgi:hypothetical protein